MASLTSVSESRIEIATVMLMGLAALLTAWASFQASLWGGVSTDDYAIGDLRQTEAVALRETSLAVYQEDQTLFLEYAKLVRSGDGQGAAIVKRDVMSKRLRDAVEQWERTPPATRESTPLNDKYSYVVPSRDEARERTAQARAAVEHARTASAVGDRYNLAAVMLAASLFIFGISSTLRVPKVRLWMIGVGAAFLIGTGVWIVTLSMRNPL